MAVTIIRKIDGEFDEERIPTFLSKIKIEMSWDEYFRLTTSGRKGGYAFIIIGIVLFVTLFPIIYSLSSSFHMIATIVGLILTLSFCTLFWILGVLFVFYKRTGSFERESKMYRKNVFLFGRKIKTREIEFSDIESIEFTRAENYIIKFTTNGKKLTALILPRLDQVIHEIMDILASIMGTSFVSF